MDHPARRFRVGDRARRLAGALAWSLVAGCSTNPATGQKELNLVSESQEIAMGMQAAAQTKAQIGPYQDTLWQAYVSELGKRLAAGSERPQLPWAFTVVDDPQVNAFALPGGFIFVTRGILTHMNSEAELAGVLGHEIGHVTARHSATQMSRAQLAQLGLGLGTVLRPDMAQYAGLVTTSLQLLFLKYTRDDETQADMLGFRYSLRAGYDPHAMLDLFSMLQGVEAAGGQGRLPTWAVTHPWPENRLAHTERMLDSAHANYASLAWNRDDYVRRLEGMVYGDDPRQGFFDGQAFYHPELKFQVVFPAGWRTTNGFSAVTGLTEKQDGLVQLGLAGPEPVATQLRTFLSQEGITGSAPYGAAVHGLPTAAAEFTAQLEQGTVAGYVAFVAYGGRTYRLMGISTADQASAYGPAIRAWIASFQPLIDPARLDVRPNTIHVVRLSRAMTVAAFNTRYPSVVPVEEVALINGVPTGGSLAAGRLAKQVVR
jgi:predicted Zn-dependent protease